MVKKIFIVFLIAIFALTASGFSPLVATAAQMSALKDTLSTLQTSATAVHTIQWTLPGSDKNTVNDTITIAFTPADIVASGTWQTSDFTFTGNAGGAAAPAAVGTGAATCSGSSATNYIVNVNAAASTFTITLCTGWTQSTSGFASTFVIDGTTTSGTGLLTNKSSDVDSSTFTVTDTGDDTDSATGALAVETNDVVTVTGTVNPTFTFAVSANAVTFGTLTSANARYANTTTGSSSATTAHTIAVGTNAASGYSVTYLAPATLTSGTGATIAAATITTAGGTSGSAQFALGVNGSATISSGYDTASNNYKLVTGSAQPLFSRAAPASDTMNAQYIANIPTTQAAGTYTATFTYVGTGQF